MLILFGICMAPSRGFRFLLSLSLSCMLVFFRLWPFSAKAVSKKDRTRPSSDDISQVTLELLRHFERPNYALPPSARVDPSVRQRQREHLGVLGLWRYVMFLAVKIFAIFAAFLAHYLWGPKKKSWGWEMTFITTVMQNASDHSHLADLPTLRRLINVAGYIPLPSDAMVTPVTFPVQRRKLRGILRGLDKIEDGKRELSGEWVVGKKLWKKLQAEWHEPKGEVSGEVASTDTPKRKDRVILYLHGGAYYMFSAATHRQLTIQLARYTDSRLFAVNYRLAPEVRFPGQLHDAVNAYLRLLDLKVPTENILIAGDSAGGALSLAMLMYLRDNGYPLPAGAIVMSPWVDLTMSCDSWDTNAPYDIVVPPKPGDHLNPISCYLGDDLGKLVAHPYASPLFGNFEGLPPLLIQAGDSEVLRDEITLLAHKARLAGVHVRYQLYEDAVHAFQQFPFLEVSTKALQACRDFVTNELPTLQKRSPQFLDRGTQIRLKEEAVSESSQAVNGVGAVQDEEPPKSSSWTENGIANISSLLGAKDKRTDRSSADGTIHVEPVKEQPFEPRSESKDKRPWSTTLRPRFGFTPFKEKKDGVPTQDVEPRARRHNRHATGEPLYQFLSIPPPSVHGRKRASSHPDITSLCQQWADSNPSDRPITYISASRPDS